MPNAYVVASEASAKGQKWFKRLTFLTLLLLVVAALAGLLEHSWAGWVSAAAFVLSILFTALTVYKRTEQDWYDGRAAAESVKSITFKYAVGGEPFGTEDREADARFDETLSKLVGELEDLGSDLPSPKTPSSLDALRELRGRSLTERRSIYKAQRIEEQWNWYSKRAKEHRKTATAWRSVMYAGQAAGAAGAVLKGLGIVDIDLMSLFATVAASTAAWIAAGDFTETARAYDFATLDLEQALNKAGEASAEPQWASFVADCEQAMSREHTMWLARRRSRH